ncbi:PREDICTED: zinc finger protein CONSTANS-LIKE 10-like isoform X2 [Lupinus angustifolius]|uniref:zinc finger protein CONSTANS-LIKE 10-like isoform X2 n=1 Tax=Lupinus angustifolius TaxID=3871 RepID=UPI00092E637D|nr:PREDICTED: zinc finger protein CONSTANS-LIKE 10-like isoform X2 [Lupinus angustifolius]
MKRTRKQSKDFCSSSSSSSSLKPLGRKNRTKTRKPKFLSLRLQLSQPNKTTTMIQQQQQPQLNLFPLHPETTVVDEKLDMHEETNDVALFFTSDCSATLNGLLEDESTITKNTTSSEEEEGSLSAFDGGGGGGCGGGGESGSWLVKKAMRRCSKEDDGCEERWVCYSEVTSATVSAAVKNNEAVVGVVNKEDLLYGTTSFGVLSLKLDHEGIMNAWSDKGSLYVEGEGPQTVPNFHHLHNPNVPWDGWGSDAGNTWTVPESCGANKMKEKEEMGWKLGQREASVLRYKEKRQSRLFSKRIRYEVRKLNAEKRPRMKGRFVKRE